MTQSVGDILSKEPCNEDLFAGNAHKRLAKVIADEIRYDKNCSIIGIDGGWGSGKSNLVGLVDKELCGEKSKGSCTYNFFTYDAWGHQNDLPRRSILEELTSFLTKDILNTKNWNERLENLLAKKKRTSTKTVPRLNFAIIALSLLIAATPIINSVINAIPYNWGKILFSSLLYLLIIGWVCWKQIRNMKENSQDISIENFLKELFLLYKDKIEENEKFETISEKEPSTKQFKDWMKDIDNDLNKEKKFLIIVIDNMDRLPKIKVQELWSAIHSFFSEEKYTNIRVIVPFDRLHIRNAFQSEDLKDTSNSTDSNVAVYGDDFINKTFYVVYHVAPPILSEWKQYFNLQWQKAFGEGVIADNAVVQIYDLMVKEHSPRKIVAFINEFVTIKRISDKTIPDKYIALFIFGRTSITKDPMKEILTPSYLSDTVFIYKEDEDLPKFISSLYFQLPVRDAMDVVYTRQFKQELESNNPESLTTMYEKGLPKFYSILDRAITEVVNVENAVLALDALLGKENSFSSRNIWNNLYYKELIQKNMIKEFHTYHKVLLGHIENKREYWKALITGYHNNLTEETNILEYADGIDELASVQGLDVYGILSKINKRIAPKQFIGLIDSRKEAYFKYGVVADEHELSDYLSNLDISSWNSLQVLPYLNRNKYPLESFIRKLEIKLSEASLKADEAEVIFNRLKELKTDRIQYQSYFNGTKLDQLYNSASQLFKADCLAMRLSSNSYSSNYSYIANALNTNDTATIIAVATVVNKYTDYGSILLTLENSNNNIFKGVAKELTIGDYGKQEMDILAVATKFDIIVTKSEISSSELFTRMNDWCDKKERIKQEDVLQLPYEFFKAAKDNDCELSKYILLLVEQYLVSITQSIWVKKLSDLNCREMKLLFLHHTKPLPEFYNAFKQKMKEYAQDISKENLNPEIVDSIIEISKTMNFNVSELFREIRDFFMISTITLPKLKYFGKWLFEYGLLEQKVGTLEVILPTEMLADSVVISLMMQHKGIVKEMMRKSQNTNDFIVSLKSKLSNQFKDNKEYKDFCSYLGIE